MKEQTAAYGYALAAVVLWSTAASAFKISLRYLDPIQLLLYASIVSLVALFTMLVLQGKVGLLFRYTRRQLALSAALGVLNPFLYYLILLQAYELLPAQEAQPLNYTWAIMLAVLSIPLLQQKIGRWDFAAILISYAGVVVIATQGDVLSLRFSNPLGVALALSSTVIWALYWIYNTKDTKDPVAGLFLSFLFALPLVATAVWALSTFRVEAWQGLAGAAYVGLFEMGITFVLWLQALKRSTTTVKVANLIFLAPFLSLVFIHFLVGEEIRVSTFIGLVFIIAGNLLQQLERRSVQKRA